MRARIRASSADDAQALFQVWLTAVAATHDFLSREDHESIAVLVRDQYLPTAVLDVVVDESDRPLAFMGMTGNAIDSLFVHAAARGTGLGRQLVELARTRATALATEVNEQNRQGLAFWTHMGFRRTGRTEVDGQGRPYPLLIMAWP